MTEDDLRALGNTRRLVFQNIANGVPMERVMADMYLSELEVDQALKFVAKKITEHLVLRRQPTLPCENQTSIRFHRHNLLAVLSRIGDLDLSTDLILSRITVQAIDHPEMVDGAKHRLEEAYR